MRGWELGRHHRTREAAVQVLFGLEYEDYREFDPDVVELSGRLLDGVFPIARLLSADARAL